MNCKFTRNKTLWSFLIIMPCLYIYQWYNSCLRQLIVVRRYSICYVCSIQNVYCTYVWGAGRAWNVCCELKNLYFVEYLLSFFKCTRFNIRSYCIPQEFKRFIFNNLRVFSSSTLKKNLQFLGPNNIFRRRFFLHNPSLFG